VSENVHNSPTVSDSELLRRHLEGDSAAFEALVERFRRPLYNFLYRFCGDQQMAEDVFQETFLQLHISGAGFDLQRRLKPWLFTIAANKARDALRRRGRRRAAPLDATVPGSNEGTTTFADLIPGNLPDPGETSMNLETRSAVQTLVSEMPENLRAVLVLAYFHEMPYKEIAQILDIPLGTVKSRIHAAVKHFARKWQAHAQGRGDANP
jgi:RNA polymerase sigma-70 factor (ECF subfamily)